MANKLIFSQLKQIVRLYNPIFNNSVRNISNLTAHTQRPVEDTQKYSKFEVSRNPEEWKYVERLLAPLYVPDPKPKAEYPSNWQPPSDGAASDVYFVQRNKNHMVPVYLTITYRGMRKITVVRRVQGDVFALEKELKAHLQKTLNRPVGTQVNELIGVVKFKGDFVNAVKEFLINKGF